MTREELMQKAFDSIVEADIIGSSALLITTMAVQKEIEKKLEAAGLKGRFRTMVGCSPVTSRWRKR
ncbi:MAG: hypothetical protein ACOX4R_05920 [Lentihominibacter sp.]|jgi:trimethylamine corrinoid protein